MNATEQPVLSNGELAEIGMRVEGEHQNGYGVVIELEDDCVYVAWDDGTTRSWHSASFLEPERAET